MKSRVGGVQNSSRSSKEMNKLSLPFVQKTQDKLLQIQVKTENKIAKEELRNPNPTERGKLT